MLYRKLGNSDINVSRVCLGSMTWGEQNSTSDAHRQLDAAFDAGVNFVDTAEIYPSPVRAETSGNSEHIIGSWLKQRNNRHNLVLASKVAGPAPKKWIGHVRGGPRLDATQIRQALCASLKRLQTDYLDLYQLHWPARNTNYFDKLAYQSGRDRDTISIEALVEILDGLVGEGLIRRYGVCNESAWGIHRYRLAAVQSGRGNITCVQNPYNLLNRIYEIGLAEFADRENIDLLAYSPLGNGALSGKYLREQIRGNNSQSRLHLYPDYFYRYTTDSANKAVAQYTQLANKHEINPAQMALAFVMQQPFVCSTIIGATTIDQLQQNIDAINISLDQSVLRDIEKIHRLHASPCA